MRVASEACTLAPVQWDPYDQAHFADPYPAFRRLREEAPLYYNAQYDFHAVSRYDDCVRVLRDRDVFISSRGVTLDSMNIDTGTPSGMFIVEDPPLHTIHRGILTRAFTPKRVAAIENDIRLFCAKALDPRIGTGGFDFIEDLALEMPMRVIGMILGMPEQDLKEAQRRVTEAMHSEPGKPRENNPATALYQSYADYVDWRMRHPTDDLMTDIITAEFPGEDGSRKRLTREEILSMITLIFIAGNETTNRLIGWTGKLLGEHAEQRKAIAADRSLIPQAIEEVLRFEPPGPYVGRVTAQEVELHGTTIAAGSPVLAIIAAGNRDSAKFSDGDRFDIHRGRIGHLTFGHGFHSCLGNALARLEGRIALDEVLDRFPDWQIDLASAKLSPTSTVRGWDTLPAHT
jgi:cytochrome P450